MGYVVVGLFFIFLWIVFSLLGGVATFCASIVAIFQHKRKRFLKLFIVTLFLLGPSLAFIIYFYGPFPGDLYKAVAVGMSFMLIFTLGIGFLTRNERA